MEVELVQSGVAGVMDAFYLEHLHCGELDAGVEDDLVWMTCTCGAVIVRPIDG